MSTPLVSVLLPVYNGAPYLDAALASVVRQDYRHLEIIAIDDGSTDGSLEVLKRYQQADDRIFIVSRENRGLIATLNEGLALAKGELVARMDADDVCYPARLSRQVSLFQQHPHIAVCGTGIDTIVGERVVRGTGDPVYRWADLGILSKFFTIFMHSTVVYNRNVIPDEMLRYDPRYLHAEDFDLFRRITQQFSIAMMSESLVAYRIHDESVTNKHKREMRKTHLRIVAENLERESLLDDAGVFESIADHVTANSIKRAAECLLALEANVTSLPTAVRASYEVGVLNLFYFLYQLIGDERRPRLMHEFLTNTQKWRKIRRRERYGLLPGAYLPWFSDMSVAANRRVDALSRYLQSVPAARVLPPFNLIG
jgi:glycosyltransferase involved in cell wall biosynthesis